MSPAAERLTETSAYSQILKQMANNVPKRTCETDLDRNSVVELGAA